MPGIHFSGNQPPHPFSWRFDVFQSSTTAEIELTPQPECTLSGLGHCLEGPGGLKPLQIFGLCHFLRARHQSHFLHGLWALFVPRRGAPCLGCTFQGINPPSFSWRFDVFQISTTAEIELTPQPECTLSGLGHCLEGPGCLKTLQIFGLCHFF